MNNQKAVIGAVLLGAVLLVGLGVGAWALWRELRYTHVGAVGAWVVIAGGAALLAWGGFAFYDSVYGRFRQWQNDGIDLVEQKQQVRLNAIRVLPADRFGRQGIAFDGQVYKNLDTGEAFTQELTLALDPIRTQLDLQHKMLQTVVQQVLPEHYHVINKGGGDQAAAMLEPGAGLVWPESVAMSQVLQGTPSLERVVIGARPTPAGGLDVIGGALHDLTHVLIVGGSGWGKSCFLRALLYQLAQSPEPFEVAAIDTSGSEFNILRTWSKLRYPVARTTQDAEAILYAVRAEIDRRKGLFEQYPRVTKLSEYNLAAGEHLPVLFVLVDEGTNLLAEPGIGDGLRAVVQCARQYGICAVLAGQSANYKVIPTQTRDNFSARVCFHTSPSSSQAVLDDRGAADLRAKGRAICQLPGRDLVEVQTPWIDRAELERVLTTGDPAHPMPKITFDAKLGLDEKTAHIRDLAAAGKSKRQIALEVFGYDGGAACTAVNQALG